MCIRDSFKGKLVVVTGASSGLGREIARILAYREGANLVVTARRRERLEELKAEIESRSASRVYVVQVDLADPAGADVLFKEATAHGDVFALISNAGVTYYGKTLDGRIRDYEQIINVNFMSVVRSCMLFLPYFLDRGTGALLTVTSFTALSPAPYQTVYSASKHATQAFMEGLAQEYKGRGVVFCTFAPGGMATEMNTKSGTDKKHPLDSPVNMDAGKVARIAVRGFKKGKLCAVPGLMYKTASLVIRFVPRSVLGAVVERIFQP